jgi:DNA-binding PadR family transcriptional regulator
MFPVYPPRLFCQLARNSEKNDRIRWQVGGVYVPLEKLARKGYLEKYPGGPTAERGGRRKSLYRLTDRGRQALKHLRTVHETVWEGASKIVFE